MRYEEVDRQQESMQQPIENDDDKKKEEGACTTDLRRTKHILVLLMLQTFALGCIITVMPRVTTNFFAREVCFCHCILSP